MPKVSMKNLSGDGVGQPSVMLGVCFADVIFDPLYLDANAVPSTALSESTTFSGKPINHILRCRCYADVLVSVVQTVAIYMIRLLSILRGQSEYFAMHQNAANFAVDSNAAYRVPLIAVLVLSAVGVKRCPFELGKIRVAMRGYDSALALRKRDFTVGCIRGCHSLSYQRLGFGGTTNPDTLILPKAEPRYAMEGQNT